MDSTSITGRFVMPYFTNDFIKRVKSGDPVATRVFYEGCKRYVIINALKQTSINQTGIARYDDLLEIGNYVIGMCLNKYNLDDPDASFVHYFKVALKNEFTRHIKKEAEIREKTAFSLDFDRNGDVVGGEDMSIFGMCATKESIDRIAENIESKLTDEQRKVFQLRLAHKDFKDIAKQLNTNEKHVRYVYATAKKLLKVNI